MAKKRQLSNEEKSLCQRSIKRLGEEKDSAILDSKILSLKLENWDILKNNMRKNIVKTIGKLEIQLEEYKKMLDDDLVEQKADYEKNLEKFRVFIDKEYQEKIDVLNDQLQNGVEVKPKEDKK